MKKYLVTFLPASLLLAFLAFILATCGGGGGGGGSPPPTATLTGLSVDGPASVREYGTGTYTATANWSDNSTTAVAPTWSVNSQAASISASGVLSCLQIDNDQAVTVTATYPSGGVTETATKNVALTNIATIPFTAEMVSGKVFFEENFHGGGASDSYLFYHNADFTYGADWYEFDGTNESSGRETGTWSIDASGKLILNYVGGGTFTVALISGSESSTGFEAVVDDGGGSPWIETLEKTVPIDPAKLPGTYRQSAGDYTWVINANGTGTVNAFGGFTFTWSVDSAGVLKMPASNGYSPWWYARASSQSTASEYTVLKVGFVEINPAGGFYKYYGGHVLTRQ